MIEFGRRAHEIIDSDELKSRLKISHHTLLNLIDEGMPYFRLSYPEGHMRFVWEDVLAWIRSPERQRHDQGKVPEM